MTEDIKKIKKVLTSIDGEFYIVGGYVRNLIMKNNKKSDIDIIYDGDIKKVVKNIKMNGWSIFPINADKDIYRCFIEDNQIDIAKIKGNSLYEDLYLRDFKINAIAINLHSQKLIDPFNGICDIENKIVSSVNENSIKDDPIRILRAIRIIIDLNMQADDNLKLEIKEYSKMLKMCHKERFFSELMNILNIDRNGIAFEILNELDVLKYIIPNTEELKTIGVCKYHSVDVFTHMNITYKTFQKLINENISFININKDYFRERVIGEYTEKVYMAFTAFVHDIGKFNCYRNKDGKVTFYSHEIEGAKIIKDYCNKNKFPKKASKLITNIVKGHMYPLALYNSNIKNYKKSFYKFFSQYEDYVTYIITISYCDVYATRLATGKNDDIQNYKNFLETMAKEYNVYEYIKKHKLINGYDILSIIGEEKIYIKDLINEMTKLTYLQIIKNKEDALRYVKSNYKLWRE